MTFDQFQSKVKKLETSSKKHPKMYKFKVLLVALLGYSYIFLVLALLIAMVVGLIILYTQVDRGLSLVRRLIFPILILAFIILKSLFIKFEKPIGIYLDNDENNELIALVENLSKKLKMKRIHQIILTDEMNAALYQYPRLGVLGLYHNYLILGLPLMATVSKEELESIIAHELGHLSGKHGQFGAYIYRLSQTWTNILSNLKRNHSKVTIVFEKFLKTYLPFFNAYTFVLRREDEYFADKIAAELTSPEVFSAALMKLDIITKHEAREFSQYINQKVKEEKEPINGYYTELFNFFKSGISKETIDSYIIDGLSAETSVADTHPALKDRINAINGTLNPNIVFSTSAFEILISNPSKYITSLNQNWKQRVEQSWTERHEYFSKAKNRLNELLKIDNLDHTMKLEKAEIIELLEDSSKALPIYQEVLNEDEDNIKAKFAVGRILLDHNNKDGLSLVKEVMKKDLRFTGQGCRFIYQYLIKNGESNEAQEYYKRAVSFDQNLALAKEERKGLRQSDKLCEHELNEEEINEILKQLEKFDFINEVYLVRKDVKYLKEYPLYVLGIKFTGINIDTQRGIIQKMANEIELPSEFFIVPLHQGYFQLLENIKKINNSQIK